MSALRRQQKRYPKDIVSQTVYIFSANRGKSREASRLKTHTLFLAGTTCLIALAFGPDAQADDAYDRFNQPFRVYVGGFWPTVNSEIGINGDVLPPGPPIDVEDVLNVDDQKLAGWGGVAWHISKRNSVEFEYFSLNRRGVRSDDYDPPLQLGDNFIENGELTTDYNTSIGRLTYGFSLIANERSDLQIKAGLHIADLEVGVQLAGAICNQDTVPAVPPGCPVAQSSSASENVTAPLPHFGLSYSYIMTPTLAFNLAVIGFAIELDSIDGSIIEIDADLGWQPTEHFGVGAGIRYFKTKVEAGTSDLNGSFELDYVGPAISLYVAF